MKKMQIRKILRNALKRFLRKHIVSRLLIFDTNMYTEICDAEITKWAADYVNWKDDIRSIDIQKAYIRGAIEMRMHVQDVIVRERYKL
jgi:hypothetical protein